MQDPADSLQPVTGHRNTPAGKRSDFADCLPLLVVPVSRSMTVTGKTMYGRVSRPPVNYHPPGGPAGSLSSQHKTSTMRFREASNTRVTRTERHSAVHTGTAARMPV